MSSQSPSIILGQRLSPAAEESTTSDLQQLAGKVLSILRYRRWLFVLLVLTGTIAMLAGSLWIPRQFVMRTVFERRDDPVILKLVANSPYSFDTLRRSLRFSLIGNEAVGKALDQIERNPAETATALPDSRRRKDPAREARAAQLAANLSVVVLDTNPNFDLIELRYSGDQPEFGEKLIVTLRDNYIHHTQAYILGLQRQAQKFFVDEVDKRRARVARMQAEMTQVVIEQPELAPSRPDWLNERLVAENLTVEQLTRQKTDILSEIQAREEYFRQLDEQQRLGKSAPLTAFTTKAVDNPQRVRLEKSISDVMGEIADAKTVRKMKDTHPYIEGLNRKLSQLHIEFDRLPQEFQATPGEMAQAANPWDYERNRIGMEIKSWRSKLDPIERDLARHQTDRGRLETDKTTIFDRQREYMLRQQELDTIKSDLTIWQTKLEECNRAMTAETMDRGTRFNTVEECRRPAKPTTPRLSGTFMLSGGVGLGLGILAIFLREIFDRSFRNPARVRQVLGIPVLETIGEITIRGASCRSIILAAGRALVAVQVMLVLAFGCLNYVSLENPAAYARWTGLFSTKLTMVVGMINSFVR